MAGRWGTGTGPDSGFGVFGARGVPGWVALGREMDCQVTGVASPVDSERGLSARLRYLTESAAGYEAMERAGISVRPATLFAWLAEERIPTRRNREKIDTAYWDLRRRRLGAEWKRRLEPRGTRIEIHPVDQRTVQRNNPGRLRDIPVRRVSVRQPRIWTDIIDGWLTGNSELLDAAWDDIIWDLGSEYDSYAYVSSIGFGL
ncbi:transcriptional regulator [Streptomyces sp. RFCAC02]|uniref:transcriptional regulator n=1 Tax=Streptomyces sp. RFCAC02 TaxID=2499143 RepID=UPI00102216A3|nr:transcriptional regulator [Streptomyces sp. RFCAC02]